MDSKLYDHYERMIFSLIDKSYEFEKVNSSDFSELESKIGNNRYLLYYLYTAVNMSNRCTIFLQKDELPSPQDSTLSDLVEFSKRNFLFPDAIDYIREKRELISPYANIIDKLNLRYLIAIKNTHYYIFEEGRKKEEIPIELYSHS